MQELIEAAKAVVNNWENGDLADSVFRLDNALLNIEQATFEEIDAAREAYAKGSNDDIEIDDGALRSRSPNGVWVQAWVYVPDEALK